MFNIMIFITIESIISNLQKKLTANKSYILFCTSKCYNIAIMEIGDGMQAKSQI